jgi:hypothetical protein
MSPWRNTFDKETNFRCVLNFIHCSLVFPQWFVLPMKTKISRRTYSTSLFNIRIETTIEFRNTSWSVTDAVRLLKLLEFAVSTLEMTVLLFVNLCRESPFLGNGFLSRVYPPDACCTYVKFVCVRRRDSKIAGRWWIRDPVSCYLSHV